MTTEMILELLLNAAIGIVCLGLLLALLQRFRLLNTIRSTRSRTDSTPTPSESDAPQTEPSPRCASI